MVRSLWELAFQRLPIKQTTCREISKYSAYMPCDDVDCGME